MRPALMWTLSGVLLLALVAYIAGNTYWGDTRVPAPMRGEALTNPFYAVQRFAEALGARTARDRVLVVPPSDSVIVLSAWHWDLSSDRRVALEQWVESGGRLVVDASLTGGQAEFERWSGVTWDFQDDMPDDDDPGDCVALQEERTGAPSVGSTPATHRICGLDDLSYLESDRDVQWLLRKGTRAQALRVPVGRGSVTVINAEPFRHLNLFDGDHGWLLVAATELRRGDDVHFLSEDDHPSLLALLWQHGGPVVLLSLALLAVVLIRSGVRLGPLAAPPDTARRSLAEQIRGTGQFALRHGGGDALHAASIRALDDAARRRIPNYLGLAKKDRIAALARLTGIDRNSLAAAVHHVDMRRSSDLRHTIALLEAARRQLFTEHTRTPHGTH